MLILGIESSADETAAAVVKDGKKLLSSVISSSLDLHKVYGGIVPEIAARSHIEVIIPVINQALWEAKYGQGAGFDKAQGSDEQRSKLYGKYSERAVESVTPRFAKSTRGKSGFARPGPSATSDLWEDIDAIAVTQGPGLLGSLLIGVLTARTLAIAKQKPLFAVNHVTAHPYAVFLSEKVEFPLLGLTVSGGHTQLVLMKDAKSQKLLGQSRDDAAGEAYDKVAKMLGLPYPGGPKLAKLARKGEAKAFNFPKAKFSPMKGPTFHIVNDYQFSFSGLKTAVLRVAQTVSGNDYTFPSHKLPGVLTAAQKADIAASFQRVVNETLIEKLKKSEAEFNPKMIIISGGVAANEDLRKRANQLSTPVIFPPTELCTDNAAMIAATAYHQQTKADPYSLEPNPSLT